jgi:hypothetical protein
MKQQFDLAHPLGVASDCILSLQLFRPVDHHRDRWALPTARLPQQEVLSVARHVVVRPVVEQPQDRRRDERPQRADAKLRSSGLEINARDTAAIRPVDERATVGGPPGVGAPSVRNLFLVPARETLDVNLGSSAFERRVGNPLIVWRQTAAVEIELTLEDRNRLRPAADR